MVRADQEGGAAMRSNAYCGNLLWQSSLQASDDDVLESKAPATAKTPENRARVREGSVAIFKTGDNPGVDRVDRQWRM